MQCLVLTGKKTDRPISTYESHIHVNLAESKNDVSEDVVGLCSLLCVKLEILSICVTFALENQYFD